MVLYYGLFEGRLGATPGKAIFGLRLVDAANGPPGFATAALRALAFGLPLQAIDTDRRLSWRCSRCRMSSVKSVSTDGRRLSAWWCSFQPPADRTAMPRLHDRATATRVVLKRRGDRGAAAQGSDRRRTGSARPGRDAHRSVPRAGRDGRPRRGRRLDRSARRSARTPRLDGSAAAGIAAAQRAAARSRASRARHDGWRAGASGDECWDAYEAIEGEPIHAAAARPQPWSRVRHWLADLTHEVAAGLDEGSLPALHARRVWIDRDDRGRLLDWSEPGSGRAPVDPEAVAPDLRSAQSLLYRATVGALLGVPADTVQGEPPTTPLPMPARKLLLSLRDGAFKTGTALEDAVAPVVAAPAAYPKQRRAIQIAVCALLPVVTAVVAIGAIVFTGEKGRGHAPVADGVVGDRARRGVGHVRGRGALRALRRVCLARRPHAAPVRRRGRQSSGRTGVAPSRTVARRW